MPKILRNYKGNTVAHMQVAAFSTEPSATATVVVSESASAAIPLKTLAAEDVASSNPIKGPEEEPQKNTTRQQSRENAMASRQTSGSAAPLPNPMQSQQSMEDSSKRLPKQRTQYPINANWNTRWKAYVTAGYNVVYTSSTAKRNRFGMKKTRQLILTDAPSLLYVDAPKNVLRGTIAWTKTNPPQATKVNGNTFTVTITGRVYKFEDQDGNNADTWVERINAMAKLTSRRSFVMTATSSGLDDF
jgi:hypothetical protein